MSAADSRLYPGNVGALLAGLSRVLRVMESARQPHNKSLMSIWEDDVKDIKAVESFLENIPLVLAQGSQEGTPSAAGVWFSSLIESLRPFAYYFDLNDCEGRSDGDALEIPVSDLRAARDLLKKLGIDTSLPPWAPSLPSDGATP